MAPFDEAVTRGAFLKTVGTGLAAAAFAGAAGRTFAATPARTFRIVLVIPGAAGDTEAGFQDYLSRRNFPVSFMTRSVRGDAAVVAEVVREIRETRPDLVFTWGTPTTVAVAGRFEERDPARHITDIPIVFSSVADPVGSGLTRSLGSTGSNVTGVTHIAPQTVQLNTIEAYRPFKRLGIAYNPAEHNSVLTTQSLRGTVRERGIDLIECPLALDDKNKPIPDSIPEAIGRLAKDGADLLYIGPDTFLASTYRDLTTKAALDNKLPSFATTESVVRRADALFGLFSSNLSMGQFAAHKAEQILINGRRPQDMPIENLRRFSLVINMPVARRLMLFPPLPLLNIAEVRA